MKATTRASEAMHGRRSKAAKQIAANHAWHRKRTRNGLDHRGRKAHTHGMNNSDVKTGDPVLDTVLNPGKPMPSPSK
jgi:hypothetical protein